MSGDQKTTINGSPSQYVKLNVGGSLHYTTIGTLTKHDTMLRAMFSGRMEVLTDSEGIYLNKSMCFLTFSCLCSDFYFILGWILIDRSGKHFGTILSFLRDGMVTLPETSKDIADLMAEAKYYCITPLVESCEQALKYKHREVEPICRVPLITSHKEEQLLISSTSKVNNI